MSKPPRRENTRGTTTRDVNAVGRVQLALKLRAQKLGWDEIAAKAGYGSRGAAHNAVQRELQRVVVENVEEMRREELYMLDTLHAECWKLAMDEGNRGRLFAVDRVVTISEARRQLMGLDVKSDDAMSTNMVVVREVPAQYLGLTEVKSE